MAILGNKKLVKLRDIDEHAHWQFNDRYRRSHSQQIVKILPENSEMIKPKSFENRMQW